MIDSAAKLSTAASHTKGNLVLALPNGSDSAARFLPAKDGPGSR